MNAKQKQRALTAVDMWNSSDNCSLREYQAGDRMAALLQELVDTPEPEPVAYVTGYNNGYPTIAPINSALCMAIGTALYSAPPAPSVPDVLPATNPSQISSFTEPVEWLPGGFRIEHFTKDDPMLTDEANAERRFFVTRIESPYPKDGVWFGATAGAALAKACAALGIEYAAPPAPDQSEQHLGMVPADVAPGAWRYVIPGRRRTEKFDSSRVGDYNQGWNDCRKITEKALNDLEKRK